MNIFFLFFDLDRQIQASRKLSLGSFQKNLALWRALALSRSRSPNHRLLLKRSVVGGVLFLLTLLPRIYRRQLLSFIHGNLAII